MTGPAVLQRRLFRTQEAANYLAMSEWKLKRLIQDGSVPHIQDQEGGPFLLDLNDLDNYIEARKSTGEHDLIPHKASMVKGRNTEPQTARSTESLRVSRGCSTLVVPQHLRRFCSCHIFRGWQRTMCVKDS